MAFGAGIDTIIDGIERHGAAGAEHGFRHAFLLVGNVKYGRNGPIEETLAPLPNCYLRKACARGVRRRKSAF